MAPKTTTTTKKAAPAPVAPASPAIDSSRKVSADSAARGVIGYTSGGATLYGPSGPKAAGTVMNANGSQQFTSTGSNTVAVRSDNQGRQYNASGQQILNQGGGSIAPVATPTTTPAPINSTSSREAIKAYQRANGLIVSGAISPQTQAYLNKLNKAQITASSAPVVQQETTTTSDINSLSNYDQQYDSSGLEAKYKSIQDTIEARQRQLDTQYQDDIMGLNRSFDEARTKAEGEQVREFGTTNVALQRVGGYLGTQISAVGALNNLQASHRAEISALEGKRATAIQAARNAKNAEDFKFAQMLAESVKDLDQEINKRRNEFFDQALKLTQEQRQQDEEKRATEAARNSAANQLRDDARQSLTTIISQFGGIDINNMDKSTRAYVQELADTAGIPIGSVTGKTISQQGQENTERQRAIANSISRAGLGLRQKAFNISQQISGAEAKAQGLPRALIGRNEQQVNNDLKKTTPPDWFIESQYPNGLQGGTTRPVQMEWNNFRQEVIKNASLVDFGDLGDFGSLMNEDVTVTE